MERYYLNKENEEYIHNCASNLKKIDRELDFRTCDFATVLPLKKDYSDKVWGIGGVVDRSGTFVEESYYKNAWAEFGGNYEVNEKDIIDSTENVIWFGFFTKHWGHFLLDFINRMWFLLEHYHGEYIAYVSDNEEIEGNFLRFMELLGVKKERLLLVDKPTRFRRVIIPDLSYVKMQYFTDDYVEMFKRVSKASLAEENTYNKKWKNKKIYFSRSAFSKGLRAKEFGEKCIEDSFVKSGFVSVRPETLCLDEQIYIWNNAGEIACINGSIPLNLLLCNNKTKVYVCNKTSRVHENLFLIEKIMNHHVVYIDIYNETWTNANYSLGRGPFLMTTTKAFQKFCRDKNLVVSHKKNRDKILDFLKFKFVSFSYIIRNRIRK